MPTPFADRIRALPAPDMSSESAEVCDRRAAARIGSQADSVVQAARTLLDEMCGVVMPTTVVERAEALGIALEAGE